MTINQIGAEGARRVLVIGMNYERVDPTVAPFGGVEEGLGLERPQALTIRRGIERLGPRGSGISGVRGSFQGCVFDERRR